MSDHPRGRVLAEDPVSLQRECAACGGPADIRGRHVVVEGSQVKVYCSADCSAGTWMPVAMSTRPAPPPLPRVRPFWTTAALVGMVFLSDVRATEPPPPPPPVVEAAALVPREPEPPPPPPVPTIEETWVAEI